MNVLNKKKNSQCSGTAAIGYVMPSR